MYGSLQTSKLVSVYVEFYFSFNLHLFDLLLVLTFQEHFKKLIINQNRIFKTLKRLFPASLFFIVQAY